MGDKFPSHKSNVSPCMWNLYTDTQSQVNNYCCPGICCWMTDYIIIYHIYYVIVYCSFKIIKNLSLFICHDFGVEKMCQNSGFVDNEWNRNDEWRLQLSFICLKRVVQWLLSLTALWPVAGSSSRVGRAEADCSQRVFGLLPYRKGKKNNAKMKIDVLNLLFILKHRGFATIRHN